MLWYYDNEDDDDDNVQLTGVQLTEQLKNIPKSFLLKYHKNDLKWWENSLPQHIRTDPDIQKYFICRLHEVNPDPNATQIDLPFFTKGSCPYCHMEWEKQQQQQQHDMQDSKSMEMGEKEEDGEYVNCNCDCSIKYFTSKCLGDSSQDNK